MEDVHIQNQPPITTKLTRGDLVINHAAHIVTLAGKEILLTATEFRLLYILVKNQGVVLEYDTLIENVWAIRYNGERDYLHTYIRRLRREIDSDPHSPRHIINIRGVGYRFDPLP